MIVVLKPLIGKSCSSKIHLFKNVEWGRNILVKMLAGKSQEVRLNTCLIKDLKIIFHVDGFMCVQVHLELHMNEA